MIWVTGASGDLGKCLVDQLKRDPDTLPLVDDLSTARVELTNAAAVDAAVEKRLQAHGVPSAIFHSAVYVELSKTESNPSHTLAVNTLGTVNLLQALAKRRAHPWFCLIGSGHVYAPMRKPNRITETSPIAPRSAYALSKMQAEQWAQQICTKAQIPLFVPRIFSFTAPWQRESFVVPRLAKIVRHAVSSGSPTLSTGWLGGYRDFLDIRDVSRALRMAYREKVQGTFNVCRGEGTLIRDIARKFAELGQHERLEFLEADPRPDDIEWMVGDPSRFQSATGFQPEIPLNTTLSEVWNYFSSTVIPPSA